MAKLDYKGQRRYVPLYTARMVDIDIDSEWLLNTITVRQAQKADGKWEIKGIIWPLGAVIEKTSDKY
jgi:hypothetical protein